jgi:hypothetical protein
MEKKKESESGKFTRAASKSSYEPPKATFIARKTVERLKTCGDSETSCQDPWHQ